MNSHINYLLQRIERLEKQKEETKAEITDLIVKSISVNNDLQYAEIRLQRLDEKIDILYEEVEQLRY